MTFDRFRQELEVYLAETLHVPVSVRAASPPRGVPVFLGRTYDVCAAEIAGRDCLFLVDPESSASPSALAKHIGIVKTATEMPVVYAAPELSAYKRGRLLEQGVSFVVPGNQLYIPQLAIDLRDRYPAAGPRRAESLSPAAQAVLFLHLLRLDRGADTPKTLAGRVGYSGMSVSRAVDELEAHELVATEKVGRDRRVTFRRDTRSLFEAAGPLLRSPVRAIHHIEPVSADILLDNGMREAGEFALSRLTDLAEPPIRTFAVAANAWTGLRGPLGLTEVPPDTVDRDDPSPRVLAIETWSYSPAALAPQTPEFGDTVDPLSLHVQFRGHADERVAAAADALLERSPW